MKRIGAIILCLALMITSISQMAVISFAKETPTITCESKECNPGDTVSIEVKLTNNPGIMYLEITPTYSSELGTPTVQNGSVISDLTQGKQYIWVADNDVNTNGTLVTFTFSVAESVAPGDYSMGFVFRSSYNYNEDSVSFTVIPATIRVKAKSAAVTGLSLDKTTATVETGDETLTLTPIFTPETATNKNLSWDSTDNSIATVKDGVVTLIKKGVVTITATTEDGGYTASCVVTINCSHRKGHDVPAEDSTCIKHGHEAYTVCDECDEVIEGSDAELPLAAHTYTEKAEAKYLKSAATCVSKAVYYKSCSVCGAKGTETFEYGKVDPENHTGGTYLKDQKEATCYEEGYTGDTYCNDCNEKIKDGSVIDKSAHNPASVWTTDETDHWKVCQTIGCGNIIDKAPHSGGEATCVQKAVCSVCGVQYGELDPNNHKHTEIRDDKAATEQEKGYTGDTWCLDCNKMIAEGEDIEMLEHKPVLVNAEEATATREGNIEHYFCESCGKYYSDEAGDMEITKESTVIAKLAPKIIEGNNAKIDKSSKEPVSFRSDAAFADFIRVELDGKELVRDKDYTLKEGSIIATLTPEFVATLTAGEHTLGIVSASGTAVASFTVTDDVASSGDSNKSPQTGDNRNIFLWCFISIVSFAALCTTTVISKKRKER